ncbi:glycosyl transferase [Sesbania bispinosa]|nr:glycosyl transferase [Sesbania bispinosa]
MDTELTSQSEGKPIKKSPVYHHLKLSPIMRSGRTTRGEHSPIISGTNGEWINGIASFLYGLEYSGLNKTSMILGFGQKNELRYSSSK